MTINYCLPIIQPTKQAVLDTIAQNPDYQYVEVWLDYITDIDEEFVRSLITSLNDKLILLFRRQKLEPPQMAIEKRQRYISMLDGTGVLLDLDINTQQDDLSFFVDSAASTHLLLSYHNYEHTPDEKTITGIITEMASYAPTIYKIATLCQSEDDALRLMSLLVELKKADKRYIILGMGEFGMVTRVFGTLWGNEMIFAPKELNTASAPGQLTKIQLEKIFIELNT